MAGCAFNPSFSGEFSGDFLCAVAGAGGWVQPTAALDASGLRGAVCGDLFHPWV